MTYLVGNGGSGCWYVEAERSEDEKECEITIERTEKSDGIPIAELTKLVDGESKIQCKCKFDPLKEIDDLIDALQQLRKDFTE